MDKQQIADGLAARARELAFEGKLIDIDVARINALAETLFNRYPAAPAPTPAPKAKSDLLTARAALELVEHEAIVLEAYKDSEGIWTWGIGVTDRSGHKVAPYKDNPSTVEHALEVYIWLLRQRYIPDVLKAFAGYTLNEAQFAAALSFHYNTGAILKTEWVGEVKAGQLKAARTFLETHYLNGGDLTARRKAEAKLFFDGVWSGDGFATIWPVKKPSYRPDWDHPKRVDIRADMDKAIAA